MLPKSFQDGNKFIKWEDDSFTAAVPVTLKIDKKGFYLYWVCQNNDIELLDISQIRDTRTGRYARTPKDPKLRNTVNIGSSDTPLEDKTLTVVHGIDLVNVNFTNFCCNSKDVAQEWTDQLLKLSYNIYNINASQLTFLEKSYTKLTLMIDRDGKLPVKYVVKQFASHKDDKKRIERALEQTGLPSSKSDSIHIDKFGLEEFLQFYKNLVQRNEVDSIFYQLYEDALQHKGHHITSSSSSASSTCSSNPSPINSSIGGRSSTSPSYQERAHSFSARSLTSTNYRDTSNSSSVVHHHTHHLIGALTGRGRSSSSGQNKHQSNKPFAYKDPKFGKLIHVDCLVDFLNRHQRDPRLNEILHPYADRNRGIDIIKQYEPIQDVANRDYMSVNGFLRYLMSDDNAIISPEKFELSMDMNQPLNHYFINSSHNTYLAGHQLTGKSSVEMYRQCLLAGCRCVELDCWNGRNSDEEPIVTHGYTVVSEISLKEVLEAIAESAFKTSPYPVILSFENHCSARQQAKIAQYCRRIFTDDTLLTAPLDGHPLLPGVPLPSPNQLIRKIIIKNKKKVHIRKKTKAQTASELRVHEQPSDVTSPVSEEATVSAVEELESEDSDVEEEELVPEEGLESIIEDENQEIMRPITTNTQEAASLSSSGIGTASDTTSISTSATVSSEIISNNAPLSGATNITTAVNNNTTPNASQILPDQPAPPNQVEELRESEPGAEMSSLVVYIQPIRFHSFELAEKRDRRYEVSSFVETQATSLLKERPVDFVSMNKHQLTRIYPKGTRVDSSNYMPQVFWNAGCQMVALNFQTLDTGMQLNLGIFDYNGRSGYVLKPEFMRRSDRVFDPFTESTMDGIIAGTVTIKVISGTFLSDKRVGTYVEVEMYGLPADTVRRRRTKIVPANGINPVYDDEVFAFRKVVLPDLANLRIAAFEESGKFIGYRVLPVVGLRPGYRHLSLRNESNQPLTLPTLFVKIEVNDYVPDRLSELADALSNPIAHQSMIERHSRRLQSME
ncbi:1-phosphatidylinositol 4,5-bisphosphate phosphodiesterase classes I and II, partial [Fragariocoptes setiger]